MSDLPLKVGLRDISTLVKIAAVIWSSSGGENHNIHIIGRTGRGHIQLQQK